MYWDTCTSWIGCQQCFYIFVVICVCVLNVQGIRIFISNWIETEVSTRGPRQRVDDDPEAYYCQEQTWIMPVCVWGGEGERVVIVLAKCECMCMHLGMVHTVSFGTSEDSSRTKRSLIIFWNSTCDNVDEKSKVAKNVSEIASVASSVGVGSRRRCTDARQRTLCVTRGKMGVRRCNGARQRTLCMTQVRWV